MDCVELKNVTYCFHCELFDNKRTECFYSGNKITNVYAKPEDCPIRTIGKNKLRWKPYFLRGVCAFRYSVRYSDETEYWVTFDGRHIDKVRTLEEGIKMCQDHYDELCMDLIEYMLKGDKNES